MPNSGIRPCHSDHRTFSWSGTPGLRPPEGKAPLVSTLRLLEAIEIKALMRSLKMSEALRRQCALERLEMCSVRCQRASWLWLRTVRNTVQAQQRIEIERQQYEAETQRLLQLWVAEIKEKFMAECVQASHKGQLSCTMWVEQPQHLPSRGVTNDLLQQQLQGLLAELGFQDGTVSAFNCYALNCYDRAQMIAKWSADDATSTSLQPIPTVSGGTCVTCPICHEDRPAVVLVPCGHVVCRDCHRSQQLRQCPMCRKATGRLALPEHGTYINTGSQLVRLNKLTQDWNGSLQANLPEKLSLSWRLRSLLGETDLRTFAMTARKTVNLLQAYDAETQRLLQVWLAEIKDFRRSLW
eukprot:s588_g4.t1